MDFRNIHYQRLEILLQQKSFGQIENFCLYFFLVCYCLCFVIIIVFAIMSHQSIIITVEKPRMINQAKHVIETLFRFSLYLSFIPSLDSLSLLLIFFLTSYRRFSYSIFTIASIFTDYIGKI